MGTCWSDPKDSVRETLFASEAEWPPVDICTSDRVVAGIGDDTMQKLPLPVWTVCLAYLIDPDPMRTLNPEHDRYRNYLVDLVPNHVWIDWWRLYANDWTKKPVCEAIFPGGRLCRDLAEDAYFVQPWKTPSVDSKCAATVAAAHAVWPNVLVAPLCRRHAPRTETRREPSRNGPATRPETQCVRQIRGYWSMQLCACHVRAYPVYAGHRTSENDTNSSSSSSSYFAASLGGM